MATYRARILAEATAAEVFAAVGAQVVGSMSGIGVTLEELLGELEGRSFGIRKEWFTEVASPAWVANLTT